MEPVTGGLTSARRSGYWSDTANADLPTSEVAELHDAGFMLSPRVIASLGVLSAAR